MPPKRARKAPPSALANRNSKGDKKSDKAASATQASLADELSATHLDAPHDGYESSTHTDNDDFEDAADGSPADGITPSSSADPTDDATLDKQDDAKTSDAAAKDPSIETTADDPAARRPSLAADTREAQVLTPKPTEDGFPGLSDPTSALKENADDGIPASSSVATLNATSSNDNSFSNDVPLSSAEIRDSQSASDSLILDEEKAKLTLPDHVEKVPPSVGATSLLEPDETISNPFASTDESASQPVRYSQTDTSKPVAAHAPDTPGVSSTHFSNVSLGGASPAVGGDGAGWTSSNRRDSRRDTITTTTNRSVDSEPVRNGAGNYDFLLARLETQHKRLSGDPKQMRASLDGAIKLKEHFDKLRDGQRLSHTEQVDPPQPTSVVAARDEVEPTSTDTAYTGPPASDTAEDQIDWEFWGDVMSNYQSVARTSPRQLSRAIQAGIPPALRGMMWQLMSSSKNEEMEIIYAYYLKQSSPHEKAIRRDLNRTFPEQDYFQDGKGVGQENLYNVIKAYSLYDPEVGYCQGMQFVVGPLLLNMPDEEAFSTFVRLMKSYDLRGHFTPNMPALQLRLFQFDRLLEDFLPLLHRHLVRQGVKSSMYASQWFMTLFSYRFPLDFVYRILDSVFAEGVEALFRFAVALMKRNEEVLLEMPFDRVVTFLKMELFECYRRSSPSAENVVASGPVGASSTISSVYHTNAFVRDAFNISITPFQLDTYASEFDTQVRAANAHRRETEALRLVNRNLAARVKALEDQLNSVNAEHVEMVKDVVMAKIAKEEMAEELVRYKMMYAEAVLSAEQESGNNRSSARGLARAQEAALRDSAGSGSV
ncbi:Rab-GTPase-TBC domain protein [Kalmanozyma brasiliensis GHG001]|uniref:GTPase-activating protein GYP5 n=1 Tax=Kalmanozyma brasiliensis (strain GHG001) TaxID=1365824 RepID=V5EZX8_KALBG|nr:Rab-GTPase-TBC domain protein [Kalmanozyma brasiliensis GHG001]EST09518.1 Rab-GTPase-TBC domain protein [Kalmanozyma brasiliensis GHG001]